MATYARISSGGTKVCGQTNFPPTHLLKGERLTIIDRVFRVKISESFRMSEGRAVGTMYLFHEDIAPMAKIVIESWSIEDALKLHEMMLERVGVKMLRVLPFLPNLADRWARFVWLLRWIWHGHAPAEDTEA